MLDEMTATELNLWMEFFGLEPFGSIEEDHRTALVIQAECASSGVKAPDFYELFPRHKRENPQLTMTPEEYYQHMKNMLG